MGLHQTKKFCRAKKTINKIKRQPMEWKNIFTDTSDKELMSKMYKDLRRKHRQQNLGNCLWQFFIGYISPGKGNK